MQSLLMPEIKPRCETCPFVKDANGEAGVCRRYPPVPYIEQSVHPISKEILTRARAHWPVVSLKEDYCGDHPLFAAARSTSVDSRLTGEIRGAA